MVSPAPSHKQRNARKKKSHTTNCMLMTIISWIFVVIVIQTELFGRKKSTKDDKSHISLKFETVGDNEGKAKLRNKIHSIEDKNEIEEIINIVELQDNTNWTTTDMWEMLGCDEIFEKERPIHSQAAWNNMRSVYQIIVNEDSSIKTDNTLNGFQVPVKAIQVPPKGRGIFAVKDISAGELIWSTTKTARFRDGPSYRKFLFNIENGQACDVLQWAYVQDIGDGHLRASVDIDEGCFCNNEDEDNDANMGCDKAAAKNVEGGCENNYFALRDIKAGEEIICDYGQFADVGGWEHFGLA